MSPCPRRFDEKPDDHEIPNIRVVTSATQNISSIPQEISSARFNARNVLCLVIGERPVVRVPEPSIQAETNARMVIGESPRVSEPDVSKKAGAIKHAQWLPEQARVKAYPLASWSDVKGRKR